MRAPTRPGPRQQSGPDKARRGEVQLGPAPPPAPNPGFIAAGGGRALPGGCAGELGGRGGAHVTGAWAGRGRRTPGRRAASGVALGVPRPLETARLLRGRPLPAPEAGGRRGKGCGAPGRAGGLGGWRAPRPARFHSADTGAGRDAPTPGREAAVLPGAGLSRAGHVRPDLVPATLGTISGEEECIFPLTWRRAPGWAELSTERGWWVGDIVPSRGLGRDPGQGCSVFPGTRSRVQFRAQGISHPPGNPETSEIGPFLGASKTLKPA